MIRNYSNFRALYDAAPPTRGTVDRKVKVPDTWRPQDRFHNARLRPGPDTISIVYQGEPCITYHADGRITVVAAPKGAPTNLNKFLPADINISGHIDRRVPPALSLGQSCRYDHAASTTKWNTTVPFIRCDEPVVIHINKTVIQTAKPFYIRELDRRKASALREEHGLKAFTAWLDAVTGLEVELPKFDPDMTSQAVLQAIKAQDFIAASAGLERARARYYRHQPKDLFGTALRKLSEALYDAHDAYTFTPKHIINVSEFRNLKPCTL